MKSHYSTTSLWSESLKTVVYLFNRVPSKAVTKTPHELWTKKSPSIRQLHVLSCPAEARTYMPHEKKLDLRTARCLFARYSERYRGFRFYCPSTKNIKTNNAKFIEDIQNSGSQLHMNFTFEQEQIVTLMTTVQNDEVVILLQHENTVVPL